VSAVAACAAMLTLLLACSSQPALAASSPGASLQRDSSQLVPYIIGGQEATISQFPWQVYVVGRHEEGGGTVDVTSCGGSILNATTILTAAHCVDHESTTTTYAAEEFAVLAGASNVHEFTELVAATGFLVPPSGAQASRVSKIRTDPYYAVLPNVKDDVAILTLEKGLELSEEKHAQAISLVQAGSTPAPGTTLSISGYGKQEGAESAQPNGGLYSTTLTAIGSDACREEVGVNSAVLLCAQSPSSSTCQGDSGGPLVEGSPAIQVGIVDFGAKECPVGEPDVFTNLAAPEVRDFIEGSESPPVASRATSPPVVKSVGPALVDFSPLTCEPGGWTTPPTSFTYTFQVENASAQVLQSATGNIFAPSSTAVGDPLVCIVQATSPGGTSTARSGTTLAIAADSTPPAAKITTLKCHLQACTLSFTASDPNGVALSEQVSAAYSVAAKCPVKKRRKKRGKKVKQPVCHKTLTVPMSAATLSPGSFQATVSRLPYGEAVTFIVDASNAAGLQAPPASAVTTPHKPKPKKSKRKPKKRK